MKKRFNTTGVCIPTMHYMVDITDKLDKIIELIKEKDYFIINRPRQYGKTTTMYMLEQRLKNDYLVVSMSFEGIGDEVFLKEKTFSKVFIELMAESLEFTNEEESKRLLGYENDIDNLRDLSKLITRFVRDSKKDVILFIDEVDKNSNNQLFLSFLGMLRNKYLLRQQGKDKTFSSVILAGVYDIKNLKLKFRNEDEKKYAAYLAQDLRLNGFVVETEYTSRSLKAQFRQADRLNAKYIAVLNSEDLDNNEIKIKNTKTKEEEIISLEALIYYLDEKLTEEEMDDYQEFTEDDGCSCSDGNCCGHCHHDNEE